MFYRNKENQLIKEVIEGWMSKYRHNDKLYEGRVIALWDSLVGPMISNETEHIYIKNKVLIVRLKSQALKHEMEFAKKKLVKLINKKAEHDVIKDILFV